LKELENSLFAEAFAAKGEDRDKKLRILAENLQQEIENLADRLRMLILLQRPQELLGYLWSHWLLLPAEHGKNRREPRPEGERDPLLVALEYVHATLSCFDRVSDEPGELDEKACKEILECAERITNGTSQYCLVSSLLRGDEEFGSETSRFDCIAKMAWTAVRGSRYAVLEEEFLQFVLEPHNDALLQAYGVGANEVASGIQSISNAMRAGIQRAANEIAKQEAHFQDLASHGGLPLEKVVEQARAEKPDMFVALDDAWKDLFFGGICNVSRQTSLPKTILEDLSFTRGENAEFFAPGPFCGTLLRTLPARVRPLVQLGDGFYATDPQFVRDAAYRAIQRGLQERVPSYKEEWNRKQRALGEGAFPKIFASQLQDSSVYSGICYRDLASGNWVENDTLITLDDVLIQVECKAGVGVMHSPATNFPSHVRAIQKLIVDAYLQTKRFLEYLSSAAEVSLYNLVDGEYVEVRRIRLGDYRLVLPIGLTVESFSPFSTMCKALPSISPLLGKFPFMSMSIDDLLVLKRFLPTAGMLFHYLEVRQQASGIRSASLFDEMDHLGAYISQNRFDATLRKQLADGYNYVAWDGFSAGIDDYFATNRWLQEPPPSQSYPDEILRLLEAFARTHSRGWLRADSAVRDLSSGARDTLASVLRNMVASLRDRDHRWFVLQGDTILPVWIHRHDVPIETEILRRKAEIAILTTQATEALALHLSVDSAGQFKSAGGILISRPQPSRSDYATLVAEARTMSQTLLPLRGKSGGPIAVGKKKPRPNEPCWCGSDRKFKKCHGAIT
jgi:hypothetical protein